MAKNIFYPCSSLFIKINFQTQKRTYLNKPVYFFLVILYHFSTNAFYTIVCSINIVLSHFYGKHAYKIMLRN